MTRLSTKTRATWPYLLILYTLYEHRGSIKSFFNRQWPFVFASRLIRSVKTKNILRLAKLYLGQVSGHCQGLSYGLYVVRQMVKLTMLHAIKVFFFVLNIIVGNDCFQSRIVDTSFFQRSMENQIRPFTLKATTMEFSALQK